MTIFKNITKNFEISFINTLYYVFILLVLIYILTSDISIRYFTRNMATATKHITDSFKKQGMNEVQVEGKVSLGVVSFKVNATDKN